MLDVNDQIFMSSYESTSAPASSVSLSLALTGALPLESKAPTCRGPSGMIQTTDNTVFAAVLLAPIIHRTMILEPRAWRRPTPTRPNRTRCRERPSTAPAVSYTCRTGLRSANIQSTCAARGKAGIGLLAARASAWAQVCSLAHARSRVRKIPDLPRSGREN